MGIRHIEFLFPYDVIEDEVPIDPPVVHNDNISTTITEPI